MDFAAAWTALSIGDRVAVSNGKPEPSKSGSLPWRQWRSHNFTGTLDVKAEGPPRAMKIALDPADGAQVSYEIREGLDHQFTAVS